MTSPEFERHVSPENGNISYIDSVDLMRDNPAALIVNQEMYNQMNGYFAPKRFDPPPSSKS